MANAPILGQPSSSSALYQSLGWSIIPADSDTKSALVYWRRFAAKRPDLSDIEGWSRRYPRAGIAVVTGLVSGIVVLDCDGAAGVAEARLQGLPRTPMVSTPSGGLHCYFRHPGFGVHNAAKLGQSKKIDVRGEVGYVLAPQSRRSDGRRYTWAVSPREAPLAQAPGWFARMLEKLAVKTPLRAPLSDSQGSSVNDDELDAILMTLPDRVQKLIVEGCDRTFASRSECDYYVIVQLLAAGVPDQAIEAIFDTYAVGEKYREPGQGSRYLGMTLDRAHDKVRVVRVKYADVQQYEGGRSRLHLALVVEDAPDSGRLIRCGVTVPAVGDAALSLRWAHLFEAADLPVPLGERAGNAVALLRGKRMRIQLDASRDNPVAAFHRYR
jgi:hypothetical protein